MKDSKNSERTPVNYIEENERRKAAVEKANTFNKETLTRTENPDIDPQNLQSETERAIDSK